MRWETPGSAGDFVGSGTRRYRRQMARLRPYPVTTLSLVTLVIWGNRIWLAWTNDEDSLARKVAWSLPITVFVVLAVVLLVLVLRRTDVTRPAFRWTVWAFAVGTIAFWAVRAPMILLADHPIPFKAVHAVLAVASVGASVWAARWAAPRSDAPRLGYSGDAS